MRKYFDEYGAFTLKLVVACLSIVILFTTLRNGKFQEQLLQSSGNKTQLGMAETVDDETIKTKQFVPEFDVREIILEYDEPFDPIYFLLEECPEEKRINAYVEIEGVKQDLTSFVTFSEEQAAKINTKEAGEYTLRYYLNWNGYHIEQDVVFHVLEDPNFVAGEFNKDNRVQGTLIDKSGDPISARLRLLISGGDGSTLVLSSQSSKTGIFTFYGVKPNQDYEIYIVGYEGTPVTSFHYDNDTLILGKIMAKDYEAKGGK